MPDIPIGDAQEHPGAPDDLDAAEAAGALSYAAPGTPEAEAFDLAMADELDALDAEFLAREGPDALTSDRAFRMAQFKQQQAAERQRELAAAEQDDNRVGHVLATFRAQRGWSAETLADWLGVSADDLVRLAAEVRPLYVQYTPELGEVSLDPVPLRSLADRFGAHAERLIEAFERGEQSRG
jgi:hypothetical protein